MKPNKSIILHIPSAFVKELNKYLKANPPIFKYEILYFYYIVHYILEQQTKNKIEYSQFVPINKEFLKSVTVSNIIEYVKYLIIGEFIKSDNYYVIGKKSKGYQINPDYLKGVETVEVKTNCKLFDKIINNQRLKKTHQNRLEPFLKIMKDEFMKVELDYQNAEKWVLSQSDEEKRNSYIIALEQIKDKRFRYFNRNLTNNRLDTNLTNLKKEIKQFIVGNYVNIDLKNSQPFFLSQLLNLISKPQINFININSDNNQQIVRYNKHTNTIMSLFFKNNLIKTFGIKRVKGVSKIRQIQEKPFLANLSLYTKSVTAGTFYDDFIKSYSNGITRDEVKKIMFKVLFSKNETYDKFKMSIPYKKEKEIFASVYPFVYESIKMLKENDNVILPVFLQKLESYIFIDCIAKDLVEANILPLTIHDSVIVKTEYEAKTIEIINKVFTENFNVIPTLNIEPLKRTYL